MNDKPQDQVRIKDFPGLATSLDPHDLVSGAAQVQSNAMSQAPGRLTVRRGYQKTTFANSGTASAVTNQLISMTDFINPVGNWLVYELSSGAVRAGMNPS